MNVIVGEKKKVKIPIDVVIQPKTHRLSRLPILIEAKSAGDFTNVNKRRKEEAKKMAQLKSQFGDQVEFVLFLCGYFNAGYLGYEAADGMDWIWDTESKTWINLDYDGATNTRWRRAASARASSAGSGSRSRRAEPNRTVRYARPVGGRDSSLLLAALATMPTACLLLGAVHRDRSVLFGTVARLSQRMDRAG